MPGSKSKPASRQPEAAAEEEVGEKPERFNLGDTAGLKRAVDDAVLEAVTAAGYPVDYRNVDIKIFVGLLACAVACVGQFFPGKYPATAPVLLGAVASYSLLSVVLTLMTTLIEKEAIAFTLHKPGGPALVVSSRLPRFQDTYTLAIAERGAEPPGEEASLQRSVAAYFDREGLLAKEVVRADTVRLLEKVEATAAAASKKKDQ